MASGIPYRKQVRLDGYATTSRIDFLLEVRTPIVIEVKHTTSRVGSFHYAREIAFVATDLKKKNAETQFVIVVSGEWPDRDLRILEKYCDEVVKLEDFEKFLATISISRWRIS